MHSGLTDKDARTRLEFHPRSSVGITLYPAEMTSAQQSKWHTRPAMTSTQRFEEQRGYHSSSHTAVKGNSNLPSPSKTDSIAEVCSTTSSKAFRTGFHLDKATRCRSKKGGSTEACIHASSLWSSLLCLQHPFCTCRTGVFFQRFLPRVRYASAASSAGSSYGRYASC